MPRCILCDYNNELDHDVSYRKVQWNDKEKGYICVQCSADIDSALSEFEEKPDLERPLLLDLSDVFLHQDKDG